jgi:hypothetical protein
VSQPLVDGLASVDSGVTGVIDYTTAVVFNAADGSEIGQWPDGAVG